MPFGHTRVRAVSKLLTSLKLCVINKHMKQTQNHIDPEEIDKFLGWLSVKKNIEEKTRINLYLPKIIVRLIDSMAKNTSRGELVSSLVIKEIKQAKKLPFGMFSGAEISEKEIDEITSLWGKALNEKT